MNSTCGRHYAWRGDVIRCIPAESAREAIASSSLTRPSIAGAFDPLTGRDPAQGARANGEPGSHYVTPKERLIGAIVSSAKNCRERLAVLRAENKLVEAAAARARSMFDWR